MKPFLPKYCAWELTLACNSRCIHCGSSAGAARENELDTIEALGLVDDLKTLGCESITFSGGEPLLREDWEVLGKAVVERDIRLELITNGLEVERLAPRIADTGFFAVTFSVDGDEETHDRLRKVPGGLSRLLKGVKALKKRGLLVGAVTQVNKMNINLLEDIHSILRKNNFDGWQVQLTMPHGEAASDNGSICISPEELPSIAETIVRLKDDSGFFLQAADNLGYMSRMEPILRRGTVDQKIIYAGCNAGKRAIGITSDGSVRGCLSLPDSFNEGNIRNRSLGEIWNDPESFGYNRAFNPDTLEGACSKCPFGKICRAGCTSQAVAVTGSTVSNPYCLRRLEEGWE